MTTTPDMASRFILLAEDDPGARDTCLAHLKPLGCQVVAVPDALTALERLKVFMPDLILTDVMMPGMTGYELCEKVRQLPNLEKIPILVLTALDGPEQVVKGLESGADDFLHKPVNGAELRARIRNLLKIKDYYTLLEEQRLEALREVDQLRGQLRRADRFATAGFMSSGVGHELNNVAAVLLSGMEILEPVLRGTSSEKADQEVVEAVHRALGHVQAHATQLLKMGSPNQKTELESIEVEPAAREVVKMVDLGGRSKGVKVTVESRPGAEGLRVRMVKTQFEQVVINLLLNAVDAIRDHQSERKEVTIKSSRVPGRGPSEGRLLLEIEDTGGGIPSAVLSRIFEPFFTTKGAKGTGLGLPVIRQILEEAGGKLEIATTVGVGTCMKVSLPLDVA